mmetsp:Transcript_16120/g.50555  ORF Transcript_16120/g.50555 Transcript_16120/m.50555 type:complete len:95 (+) Transcript_16120:1286-1570(+)
MHYVSKVGSFSEKDFPYTATEEECPSALKLQKPMDVSTITGPSLHQMAYARRCGEAVLAKSPCRAAFAALHWLSIRGTLLAVPQRPHPAVLAPA